MFIVTPMGVSTRSVASVSATDCASPNVRCDRCDAFSYKRNKPFRLTDSISLLDVENPPTAVRDESPDIMFGGE